MSRERLYLSLGSNIGDRSSNLTAAIGRLDEMIGPHSALSSFIETKSWGFHGGDFMNCAAMYETDLPPLRILEICKEIERDMGRRETPEYSPDGVRIYHDRIIDIDILLYGERRIDSPELRIPHPLMHEREFVMIPLKEIYR